MQTCLLETVKSNKKYNANKMSHPINIEHLSLPGSSCSQETRERKKENKTAKDILSQRHTKDEHRTHSSATPK